MKSIKQTEPNHFHLSCIQTHCFESPYTIEQNTTLLECLEAKPKSSMWIYFGKPTKIKGSSRVEDLWVKPTMNKKTCPTSPVRETTFQGKPLERKPSPQACWPWGRTCSSAFANAYAYVSIFACVMFLSACQKMENIYIYIYAILFLHTLRVSIFALAVANANVMCVFEFGCLATPSFIHLHSRHKPRPPFPG